MATLCEDLLARASSDPSLAPIESLPRFARVVLISDFFTPLEQLRERLRGFVAMGVRGHLLQVLDPAEPALPFAGRVRFEGLEQDGIALIGNVDGVRQRYRGRLEAHRAGLRDLARSLGWTFGSHLCDQPPEPPLLALYTALSTKGAGLAMLDLGLLGLANPWLLSALVCLPALWWLLRIIPPAPKQIRFPAIRFLLGLEPEEKTRPGRRSGS